MENSIYPCLWFDGKAKEAAEFYLDNFITLINKAIYFIGITIVNQ